MKLSNIINNIWMTCIVFLMIYRPALISIVSITDILLVVSIVGYLVCNNGKITLTSFIPNKEIRLFLYIIVAAALYSSILTFFAGGKWNYGFMYIKTILYSLVYAAYICSFMKKNNYGMVHLVNWLMWASVIQSAFVVIMLINNSFRTQIITHLIRNGATGITMERFLAFPQRSYGLGDGYWSGMSIVSGILADIAIVYALKHSTKYYWFVPGLLLTVAVNARTGLVIFIVGLIAIILFNNNYFSMMRKFGFIVFIVATLIILPYILNYLQSIAPNTFKWITQMSDHINNMYEQDGNATYYKLNPQYWIWPDFIHTIFGTGKSLFGSEGLANFGYSSDSGYLGIIYRGGIILSILLYYAVYLLCFCKRVRSSQYKIFGIIFLFALIIQHYKGNVFYFNEYFTLIIIFILAVYQVELTDSKSKLREEFIVCQKPV